MSKKIILGLMLSSVCFSSFADTIECVSLEENTTLEMELKRSESYDNCFSLGNIPQNTPVQLLAYSGDNIKNKITLFDLIEGGTSSYIAEYNSAIDGGNAVQSNTTNKKLAVKIIPTSYLNSNKNLTITFLMVDSTAQVIIDFADGEVVYTPPPPREDERRCRRGDRYCEEP
ncbi:hypothetical protein GCM10007978_08300 [Shewanella hanedai]|uniref:Uncharacterized protein n=1 Tax=Shewanella hanedai TaxID=25 RepID=A0A553JS82_SHEHA|nr:hypothetical protein [Shewanella hanedai]TRY15324.1 hypothetical protein FN961_06560 [Shewanella hanedai]GGI72821.1 hypothetical protein GCM10007978_08300 [Shewanella hanedai]